VTFRIHTAADAPAPARRFLQEIESERGFVPRLSGIMAGAPALLEGCLALQECLEDAALGRIERDVVLLAAARHDEARYCLDSLTCDAEKHGLAQPHISSLRKGTPLSDPRLEALRRYAVGVMENKGRPDDATIRAFLDAGYGPREALEIVLLLGFAMISDYAARLAHPAVDDAFRVSVTHAA
jgi:alkylhydroperoxidase family enzyme